MSPPLVTFYLPCTQEDYSSLPRSLQEYSEWQSRGSNQSYFTGRYHWVLQTYLHLVEAGLDVKLSGTLPSSGIVISHIECLNYGLKPTKTRILVPMLVDKDIPLPHAAIHITHNPRQTLPLGMDAHYVPPWPQIGLIPRSATRANRFETVAFIGYPENLQPAFTSSEFTSQLSKLNLRLSIPPPSAWNNFSEIDAVLAVRSLGKLDNHITKPALKLFNAWLAGVPAVLGFECAYRHEGTIGIDYLEAVDATGAIEALHMLASDHHLRAKIVAAGKKKVASYRESEIRGLWIHLITEKLFNLYSTWTKDGMFRASQYLTGGFRERLLWRRPGWFKERV